MNKIFLDTVPSLVDERDFRYSQKRSNLKQSVDLREWDSRVEDQGYVGSCVGNAIANAYELTVRRLYPDKFIELSRLFVYYNSRLFDNSYKLDIGTYIRDGLKSVARYGICSEELWPYVEENFDKQPDPKCYVDGTRRVITKYETLYTLRDVLEVLNDDRPVVIGMNIYDEFMDISSINPVVRLPKETDIAINAHAVVLVGYDLNRNLFLAKNSFGNTWGDNGYFWIPFEYMRTEIFEKWCFDISSQTTFDIDSPIVAPKKIVQRKELVVEISPKGTFLRKFNV